MTAHRSGTAPQGKSIAVIGGGSIGVAFAIVFARAGHAVRLNEPDAARRQSIAQILRARLDDLGSYGLLDEPTDEILSRITIVANLSDAIADAAYVQECAPEQLALKKTLFAELDRLAPTGAVLASASSAITASAFAANLPGRERMLVVHPGNPPFLIPVAEVVPAPFTSEAAIAFTQDLLTGADLTPVLVRKEVEGFVFNRLQGALLREAYCLVRDGVVSVEDVDRIVRDGLGLRWSVIGPFETVDLNTQGGIASHAEKMGPAYQRMGAERGQDDPWTPELVERVAAQRRALLPLEHWAERVAWRDRRLMSLVRHRKTELEA
ncbi:3-hydroxyacyl-CoA dehydrogenase [Mesorhizobium sp. YC-39]|uniref:3-hydroxyacyl-CoA dehydrogenase n=1 Tax=unclassified Mesorhizobium TaxID=325217 RepID=UPI0021E831AF|nr:MULTISPECIES: 3-hydroxyacyl-CoA dehydrogenase [unclassified Mesorhizobium]MCV3206554.1 3-hydroxyacyl-CoA dehydrogenase [Mesorhizobium sp. YC-2]MCV3227046.1 3-hydroxyacyl-CoA dehydrogenase [Mesorhizobium sp. YC-39]